MGTVKWGCSQTGVLEAGGVSRAAGQRELRNALHEFAVTPLNLNRSDPPQPARTDDKDFPQRELSLISTRIPRLLGSPGIERLPRLLPHHSGNPSYPFRRFFDMG